METVMVILVIAVLGATAYYALKFALLVVRLLFQLGYTPPLGSSVTRSRNDLDADGMNPGDYYNGPGGYDATGGYQERHEER
jgi:hypothetical protein